MKQKLTSLVDHVKEHRAGYSSAGELPSSLPPRKRKQASKQAIIQASSIVATNNETQYNYSYALTTRRPGLFHRRRYFVQWIPADDHV